MFFSLRYRSTGLMAIVAICFPVLSWSPQVLAAQRSTAAIEEIVVTARKREETLQETPVAITAFSSEALVARNISNLSEIAPHTPGLSFDLGAGNTGGAFNAQVWMRGIGQSDFLFTTDPGVGIYVDDVFYPRQLGSVLDLLKLERVEVLRGPQGTLYGKNTIGGAIRLISEAPSDKLQGEVSLTAGRYDRMDVSGSIDVPLLEGKLRTRLSVAVNNRDGYVERVLGEGDQGDIDSKAVRFMADWEVADNVQVVVIADATRKRQNAIANFAVDANPSALFTALWNVATGGDYGPASLTGDMFKTNARGANASELDNWGISTTVTWDLDDITVKSVTAYRDTDAFFGGDQDNSALDFLETTNDNEHDQFSQELQLSGRSFDDKFDWVTGLFYLRENGADTFDAALGIGLFEGLEALPGAIPGTPFGGLGNPFNALLDINTIRDTEIKIESFAAYGQGSYALTDRLSATAGIRYSHEKKNFKVTVLRKSVNVFTIAPGAAEPDDSWTEWLPRVGLDYKVAEDMLVYFSVARGFKSGGFNGRPSALAVAVDSFDPEYVWSYEVGVKSAWFDNRLIVNAAAYFNDYDDIQFTAVCNDCGELVVVVDNAGKAEIKGFELEMTAALSENFLVNASTSYIDAKYNKLDSGVQGGITVDSNFPKTPEWTYSFGAMYTAAMGDGSIMLRSDWSHQSKIDHVVNNSPLLKQAGYGLLGARASYISADETWELAVFGTNLTNEKYTTNGLESIGFVGTADANPGRPREWGVSLSYRFQ